MQFHSSQILNLSQPAVEGISCDSVLNVILGSFKLNSAHDLLLKLIPWKQAKDMFLPCSSIVPPRIVPNSGSGLCIVDNCKPATPASTFCQCLWCLASCMQPPVTDCCSDFAASRPKENISNYIKSQIYVGVFTFLWCHPRRPVTLGESAESSFTAVELLREEFL